MGKTMNSIIGIIGSLFVLISFGCATLSQPIETQMGPQSFTEKSVGLKQGGDPNINRYITTAISIAESLGFYYDASDSENGRVIVQALWKGKPVTMKMRYFNKNKAVYIASAVEQPGDVFLEKGGQKIEQLYYLKLRNELTKRGLHLIGDPNTKP